MADPAPLFDFEAVFGEDYLRLYEPDLTPERNAHEADAIARLLALKPGSTVLDLGCGHGRIANELTKRGAQVTGLDTNTVFLDRARAEAAAVGVDVEYVQGDMRALPWRRRFDAALLWYTTFGYFDEADNERVLQQAARALRPGGRLLVEQINRVVLLREGLPASFVTEHGHDLMIDRVTYDGLTERSHNERITVLDGHVKRCAFSVRLYSPAEMGRLLRSAGFEHVEVYGRDGEPFDVYARRLITVATLETPA
jgi:SAM-dependent methyltransferase